MKHVRTFGLLFALALPSPVFADIYRYTDANGVEHYTNIQPSGRGWQRVVKTGSSRSTRGSSRRAGSVRAPDPDRMRR